jgi:lysophospholipase L1-like esterase
MSSSVIITPSLSQNIDNYNWGEIPWTNFTFQPGWSNLGGEFEVAQYRKSVDGIVEIKGLIKNPTTGGGVSDITILPPSLRVNETRAVLSFSFNGTINFPSANFLYTDGKLTYVPPLGTYTGGTSNVAYQTVNITYGVVQKTVIGFGDSITEGVGASTTVNRWLNRYCTDRGSRIDNQGISGTVLQNTAPNLANNGRSTLQTRVLNRYPDELIIAYGLNDLRYGFSVENYLISYRAVLDQIIKTYRILGRNIILAAPYYINPTFYAHAPYAPFNNGNQTVHLAYVDAVRSLAREYGCKYVDLYNGMLQNGGDTLITSDGIHPNDAGHLLISNLIKLAQFV